MEKVASSLGELSEAFLLSKRVSGCTAATLATYRWWLGRFTQDVQEKPDVVSVRRFFAGLQERSLSPGSIHPGRRHPFVSISPQDWPRQAENFPRVGTNVHELNNGAA